MASLLPSATEILFAIGAGDSVVGITHECDYPPEAQRLPRLTRNALPTDGQPSGVIDRHIRHALHEGSSIYELDEEALQRLAPDLIVTQELCEVCAVAYREVTRTARHLPGDVSVLSLEPEGLDAIRSTLVTVGEMTGHRRAAELVAEAMSERIGVIASMAPPDPRPSVVCVEWTDPVMAAGHWVPEMVDLAGGRDALGRPGERSHEVSWDQVLEARPDVLVLMPCGFGLQRTLELSGEITGRPGFDDLPCAASGRVVAVDGSSYFNRPGPRIVSGLEILAVGLRASPGDALPSGAAWVPLRVRALET